MPGKKLNSLIERPITQDFFNILNIKLNFRKLQNDLVRLLMDYQIPKVCDPKYFTGIRFGFAALDSWLFRVRHQGWESFLRLKNLRFSLHYSSLNNCTVSINFHFD